MVWDGVGLSYDTNPCALGWWIFIKKKWKVKVFVYHRSNSNINKSLSLFEDGGRRGACERDVITRSLKRASHHLENEFSKMSVCLIGTMVNTQEKSTLLIYGSFGVKVAEHQVHRCSNRNKLNPCRIGAFYGYITIDGEKIHTWMPLERISCGVKSNSIWKRLP